MHDDKTCSFFKVNLKICVLHVQVCDILIQGLWLPAWMLPTVDQIPGGPRAQSQATIQRNKGGAGKTDPSVGVARETRMGQDQVFLIGSSEKPVAKELKTTTLQHCLPSVCDGLQVCVGTRYTAHVLYRRTQCVPAFRRSCLSPWNDFFRSSICPGEGHTGHLRVSSYYTPVHWALAACSFPVSHTQE